LVNFSVTLQNRNFRLFFIGQGLSNVGNMMKQIAIGWLAYRMTDSAFLLGVVMFTRELSAFLISPFAGVVADRLNKYQLILWSNLALLLNTGVLGWLTITGNINLELMILLQALFGLISGVEIPTRQAFVNDLVEKKENLTNAIALNSTLFNSARIVGPSLAGILIPLVGEGGCFLIYTFFLVIILIIFQFIKYKPSPKKSPKGAVIKEINEGMQYVYRHPPLRGLFIMVFLVTFFGISYEMLLPVMVSEVFEKGPQVFGYLTSSVGAGSILGALFLANRKDLGGLERILQIGIGVFGIAITLFAMTSNLIVALLILFVAGSGRVMFFTANNTLLQSLADQDKRGRVLSLYIMVFMGSKTLGNLMMGALADYAGASWAIGLGGIGCCISGLLLGPSLVHIGNEIRRLKVEADNAKIFEVHEETDSIS
jgi:MFS family permease